MNVPKLRFKNAEGADFPLWTMSKLGNEVQFSKGGKLGKSDLQKEGSHQCLLYGELYTSYGSIASKIFSRTDTDSDTTSQKYDVVMPTSGETAEDIATATCIPFDGILYGGDLIILRSQTLYGPFLSYQINSSLKRKISRVAQGKSVVHIGAEKIKPISFSFPCLEEQQKIASFFSTLDQKIELNERKLEALEKLKKGIGRRLLIKDPESQLENSHWKIVRISEVADLITGFPFNSSDFSKSGIRLIKGANIKRGTLSFDQKTSSFWPSDAGLTKYALETGDLLVQMDGALVGESFGRVTEDLLPALLVQRVTRIRATEDIIEIIYQIFCIGNFLKFVQSVKTNTAIPHISLQNIKDFEISIPEDVNELHKLANFFRLLDAKINLVKRKKELYTYLKSGFLQQMFI